MILHHPDFKDPITFPYHSANEVGKDLANKILKQAGLK